mgnify:CR=1 FL=1
MKEYINLDFSLAPVNEPFSCPKSSESMVPSGMLPQFMAM